MKKAVQAFVDAWRITGKDADQAVLAFAAVVDGKLVYELPE